MTATLQGIPVHLSPILPDGQMFMSSDVGLPPMLWIGTAPLPPLEAAGRDARLAVRRGLADVLTWLGETVENEPTGAEIWSALLREGNR